MKCLLPSVSRCSQVLRVSGVPLSLSQLFLGSFCLIPILRLLVSTWVCLLLTSPALVSRRLSTGRPGLMPGQVSVLWEMADRQTEAPYGCQSLRPCWRAEGSTHYSMEWLLCQGLHRYRIFTDSFNCLESSDPVLSEYSIFSHSFQISPLPFVLLLLLLPFFFFSLSAAFFASLLGFFMLLNAHIPILFANSKLLISFNHCFRVHLVEVYSSLSICLMFSFLPSISGGF